MKGMQKINDNFYVDKTKKLGQGNFGTVYKGFMVDQNRIIAVKFMPKASLQKNEDYEREIVVMQDLAKINHPNIMGYYGYEMKHQGLYCFIEFCAGGSLKQLSTKKISQIKVLALFKQLLEAMSYINELNKIHRDLKPDNILLDENLDLKIADFGLARDVEVQMTKGACTPLFAAPQVHNMELYDQKCDVWSSGLILYEMLTGKQMFCDIKTKLQLKEQLMKFKRGERKINYPKLLHKNWTTLTERMLTYDKQKRPTFKELLSFFESIRPQMQTELNTKYGFEQTQQGDNKTVKDRAVVINPYTSRQKNEKKDFQSKLHQENSYKQYQKAQKYLKYVTMKAEFTCRLVKAFTTNSYAILKNVYKYILMFLSVSYYISKQTESLLEIKAKKIETPNGVVQSNDIAEVHAKPWQELLHDAKTKHTFNIERFRKVLQKQIVEKITKTYMTRDEEKKILLSYPNLIPWIEQTTKGNFMKAKYYSQLYAQIMNEKSVYCTEQQLSNMQLNDIKTYAYIRLTGKLDSFLPESEFNNEDFVRMKKQELENMGKEELVEYLKAFNHHK